MMDEPRFAQPIPNVTVAVGRDANLPCVVEHLGGYKVRNGEMGKFREGKPRGGGENRGKTVINRA